MTTEYKKNYKPEGRRNIGKPQTTWGDGFREEVIGQGVYLLLFYDNDHHMCFRSICAQIFGTSSYSFFTLGSHLAFFIT